MWAALLVVGLTTVAARDVILSDGDEYDYIVVGGGGAGAAAAARLALADTGSVLLVEAGPTPDLLTHVPGAAQGLLGSPMDWKYPTKPDNFSCLSSQGGACRFTRGKCLGGSTSINYMLYTRGTPEDYDWDVPGWSWEDLRPYFLRYEGLDKDDLERLPPSSVQYHNTSGILDVGFFADSGNDWFPRIFDAFSELGVPRNPDINAVSHVGVTEAVGYVSGGERMSTWRAYLQDKSVKKKLAIADKTRALRVIINEGAASGVEVRTALGRKIQVRARREVLLSAGTVGTPQLLMLSGIGPADHLTSFGLPVLADLPVGDKLHDHVLPLVTMQAQRGLNLLEKLYSFGLRGEQAVEWTATRSGPLASNGLTAATAFLNLACYDLNARRLRNSSEECALPDVQFMFAYIDQGIIPLAKPIVAASLHMNDEVVQQWVDANKDGAMIVVSPVLLRPQSTGSVRLGSLDPLQPPDIHAGYLHAEADQKNALRAIRIVQQLADTEAFRGRAKVMRLNLTGCPSPDSDSDDYWNCYARHMTYSVFHATGTARVGTVVDERLRVRGVERLRVADLSVAHAPPRSSTAALAIALGERVVDFILEDKQSEANNADE